MSWESWQQEFYPEDANDVGRTKDRVECIKHSLQKWRGLTGAQLRKHGLVLVDGELRDFRLSSPPYGPLVHLRIDGDSCALCVKYFARAGDCAACPLAIARTEDEAPIKCDAKRRGERESPYDWFRYNQAQDPKPMIRWLRITLKQVEAGL